MKRLLSLVGTLVLSAGLAGNALADLTVAVPNGSEGDGLRAAAADYSNLKGVKIEIVQAPYSNLFERAATAASTRSGVFDIVLMDDPWIPFFAENGFLVELGPFFKGIGTDGPDNDFLSKSLALCRNPYNVGPYICLPYVGNAQLFFYDPGQYASVGFPDGPRTWDDVLTASTELTGDGRSRKYGYTMRAAEGNPVVADFMPIFWSFGATLFDADRKVSLQTPQALQAVKMFLALAKVAPPGVESFGADEVGTAIAQGSAYSAINWPNWVATFEDPAQSRVVGKIANVKMPDGTAAGSSEIGHWTMGISVDSKNKQEAFDFMVWATSAEQVKISALRGNPPVRFSVFTDTELTSQEQFRHYSTLMQAINFSTPRPRHPQWPEIENAFGRELSAAVAGRISAEEALDRSQKAIEAIIAR